MILNNENIKKIREDDKNMVRNITNKVREKSEQVLDEWNKKKQNIIDRLEVISDEKSALLRAPKTKDHLLKYVLESFRKEREKVVHDFLRKHLEDCHKGNILPFDLYAMRNMFAEDKAYRIIYLFLSEKEIASIVDSLEEIGIPDSERSKKLEELDKEIKKIEATL